ncbi:hypothetical protein NDU88_002516 [Pleurodeles waltl]|uniref:Uncharacterized protein n=1 Tax=Pleurodeles waltl TaxID=8319 RepID=A0AAV7UBH0_PLEWA|nr:hypothetical protein NDU88_002516 [Pleurodeles waltl]
MEIIVRHDSDHTALSLQLGRSCSKGEGKGNSRLDDRLMLSSNRRRIMWTETVQSPESFNQLFNAVALALGKVSEILEARVPTNQWACVEKLHMELMGELKKLFFAEYQAGSCKNKQCRQAKLDLCKTIKLNDPRLVRTARS